MSYTSGKFFSEQVRCGLNAGIQSVLSPETVNGEKLKEACEGGDVLANQILRQTAHYLAICLYNIYQVLNINTFVFGGGLTSFGDMLFDKVRAEFDKYNNIPLPVYFKMAELKSDFGIIGAAEFVKEKESL